MSFKSASIISPTNSALQTTCSTFVTILAPDRHPFDLLPILAPKRNLGRYVSISIPCKTVVQLVASQSFQFIWVCFSKRKHAALLPLPFHAQLLSTAQIHGKVFEEQSAQLWHADFSHIPKGSLGNTKCPLTDTTDSCSTRFPLFVRRKNPAV